MSLLPVVRPGRRVSLVGLRRRLGLIRAEVTAAEVGRDQAVAAAETVLLVLDPGSCLPETARDVEDLKIRLHGHVLELGATLSAGDPVLAAAQKLSLTPLPEGYLPSRVHLVELAKATGCLVRAVRNSGTVRPARKRPLLPRRDVVRLIVFAGALISIVLASSLPRLP
ncbi:hypothetical protein [Streptomyces halstedii]|uniref:hypothetical protein n=1 Tax=Streptomyces halstedii TaxID=1944 RepID=UPI003350D8FD